MKVYSHNPAKEGGHWYTKSGLAAYTQPTKSGDGARGTTIKDARKLGLLPSPTSILSIMAKPGLDLWRQRNAAIAAITTPKRKDETEDEFVERILKEDVKSISNEAKRKGTEIHGDIEKALMWDDYSNRDFVNPVLDICNGIGLIMECEKVVVGDGYAGKLDAMFLCGNKITVVDFKTCSNLPRKQYDEHLIQLSCYAAAIKFGKLKPEKVETANIYIDSSRPGAVCVIKNSEEEWMDAYNNAFVPLFKIWQWQKKYNLTAN